LAERRTLVNLHTAQESDSQSDSQAAELGRIWAGWGGQEPRIFLIKQLSGTQRTPPLRIRNQQVFSRLPAAIVRSMMIITPITRASS